MSQSILVRIVLVSVAVCVTACVPIAAAADRPTLSTTSPSTRRAGQTVMEQGVLAVNGQKIDYEVGTLYVPENRDDPKSRLIGVGFARIKAAGETKAPPTFHLPGGPGFSFLPSLKNNPAAFLRFHAISDIVIVDQRGFSDRGDILRYSYRTGELPLDQPGSLAASTQEFLRLSKEVVAAMEKKGMDLRGYTVKQCAEDVNDLRKALGYDKISLVATSFGSQWSFAIMRLHPEIVARAMLSGVEPLNNGYDMPSGVLRSMQRYWKEAEEDKALKPYIPAGGLAAAAEAIVARLEKGPLKVTFKDPKGEQNVTIVLGKEDFQRDFVQKPADGPAFLLSLYHGHYDKWAGAVLNRRRSHQGDLRMTGPLIDTSLGVTPQRLAMLRGDPATRFLGQWNWDSYVASADIWPTPDVGDDFRTPITTDIPVIFAQGDWDMNTPLENATDIAKSFPRSRVIIAERGGHGVLEPIAQRHPKVWEQMMEFLRTGQLPDLPARVNLPAPKFTAPDFPAPSAASAPAK